MTIPGLTGFMVFMGSLLAGLSLPSAFILALCAGLFVDDLLVRTRL